MVGDGASDLEVELGDELLGHQRDQVGVAREAGIHALEGLGRNSRTADVVEALACGTPVVTTPIPGAVELITDPDWGRLAPREAGAIAEAVRKILAARPAPETVQRGAAGFSWDANAAALVAHWRRLADQA